ncbi:MAG: ribosomal L7Ae/L30e/S12e/Gadd45 family protein [Lachnospiraceae bacterium]|nr:ribosomal L7Ae/L30e/S12e/Gadd45 family protein [Lachnospiraceae bacterium]
MARQPDHYMGISLAAKAGKIVSGEMMTEKTIRAGGACLVMIAADASEATRKTFKDHCAYYEVPLIELPDKETLGRLIGKEYRASAACTDENLTTLILKQYDRQQANKS